MIQNLAAYFCFIFAAMSVVGIFAYPGGIEISIFYVLISVVWYQTGASFIKRKKWSWWSALILISLICVGAFMSVWGTIIAPIFDSSITGVGYGRWVSLFLLGSSSYIIYSLFQSRTKAEFTEKA
jgi:hypothetical protein